MNRLYRSFLICFSILTSCFCQILKADDGQGGLKYKTEGQLFDKVIANNELIVGVKSDYPPWGMYSDDGSELIGLEIDLAKDLAKSLGVNLTLIPVNSRNRLQKVEEGAIDVVIATMGDSDSRREQSGLLLPHYYNSGVALLSREDIIFESWAQLVGREICLTAGAYYNNSIIERYKIKPVFFDGTRDTGYGVKTGQCIGWAYDNTSLEQLISDGTWSGYGFKLPIILPGPWAIAVSKSEENSKFAAYVANTIERWLRTGYILQLQDKWGLPQSDFLLEQQEIFSRKDKETGDYNCVRSLEGNYPEECQLEQILKTKVSVGSKPDLVIKVERALHLDFSPLYNASVRKQVIEGIFLTLAISASSILGSLLLSAILLKLSLMRWSLLRYFAAFLVGIFRSTPPLILMYLTFFGLGSLIYKEYGLTVPSMAAAILVFSFYAGSGIAGVLISSCETATTSINGVSQIPTRPIAKIFGDNINAVVANCVNIVKATGLASTIAVPELITTSNSIVADWGNTATMMHLLLIVYFVYVLSVVIIIRTLVSLVVRHG